MYEYITEDNEYEEDTSCHVVQNDATYVHVYCINHNRPVKLWFDPKQIATETISPVLIQEISPERHIKNII